MNVDSHFITALLKAKKPSLLRGVKDEYFDEEWQDVFKFVRKFYSDHKRLPTLSTVKGKFKGLPFLKSVEPVAFYGDELRTRHSFSTMDEMLRTQYTDRRTERDLAGSVDALKAVVLAVERQARRESAGPLKMTKTTAQRRKAYIERKKKKGLLGIPTPWKSMDEVTQGHQPGDLHVVLARASVGKTFYALLHGIAAQMKAKKNVLVSSMEMYPDRLGVRYDAIGAGVSVERYRKGKLKKAERKKMDAWYKTLEGGGAGELDLYGPQEISSPLDLELTINLGNYDLAIWDSFYLASKAKKWEEFAQLVADVKGVASRTGVPIMVTSQFNKDVKMSATTADQTAAAFTDSIMHDADFVFAMFRTSSMKPVSYTHLTLPTN